jgi:uncharacterized membrane protein YdjX (TVP38/TMEM64 family)
MWGRQTIIISIVLFTILIIAAGLWLFPDIVNKVTSLFSVQSIQPLVDYLRSLGWIGPIASIGLMVLQSIAAPLPSFVIAAANGMVFGIFWGSVISWTGGMAGALLNFWLARKLGYAFVQKWTKKEGILKRIDEIGGKSGFSLILIARLLPMVSFDAISLLAGLSSIRIGAFLLATGIGQIPGTLLYVMLGHDLANMHTYQTRLWLISGVLIGFILFTKWRTKKKQLLEKTHQGCLSKKETEERQ